jgi:MEMO1 family protein
MLGGMLVRTDAPRSPAVAGRFYPDDPVRLGAVLRRYVAATPAPARAIAAIGPHAGWVYCGSILGRTYARIEVPDRVILLCPNHTGRGARRSMWSGGAWNLPGMRVDIDEDLAERCRRNAGLEPDRRAHESEHAIEVHLPFVIARNPRARIVPIVLADLDLTACRRLGEGLAEAISGTEGEVLLVASTDMSHHLPADVAATKDRMALACIESMDAAALHRTVRAHGISMCGYVPTTCAMVAASALGATTSDLVQYGHSGEASGDHGRVVGYAGVVIGA